jgi:hypothetical protein
LFISFIFGIISPFCLIFRHPGQIKKALLPIEPEAPSCYLHSC